MSGVPSVDDIRKTISTKPAPKRSLWPLAVVVAALVIGAAVYFREPATPPDPEPPLPVVTDVDVLVARCTADYITKLAEGQGQLAREVSGGQVENQEQYFNRSVQLSTAAREIAFMPLAELENSVIPEGTWGDTEAAKVAEHLARVAEGMREALK